MELEDKQNHLKDYLKELGSLCVAFSGGVDSTFLLAVAHEVLGDKVLGVTVRAAMNPEWEFEEARRLAEAIGVRLVILEADAFAVAEFKENRKDRCYYCKRGIFEMIGEVAAENGITYVADGSNADDESDFRPGTRATKELGVVSPLKEAGLTKDDIRRLSKEMDLATWDKPSFACLASRIPYGTPITEEKLRMIEGAEEHLLKLGFKQFRVRHHGEIARIEVLPSERQRLFSDGLIDGIVSRFKEMGFAYVTLDLEGYRSGSLNEVLSEDELKDA
jgi:uncharacterized protein